MSSFTFGPLSNRPPYQGKNTLIQDKNGRVWFVPINRSPSPLPPEILSEIFYHCLPTNRDFLIPDPDEAPLILCRICHRWREVALMTPHLWSSLCLDLDTLTESSLALAESITLYQAWISRAGRTPLSLCVQALGRIRVDESMRSLLKTVATLSAQWRNIALDVEAKLAKRMLSQGMKYPLLEKFTISGNDGVLMLPASFRDAPRLREVEAHETYQTVWHMHLPWNRLAKFRSRCIGLFACLEILRDAAALLDGSFTISHVTPSAPPRVPPLTSLRSLTLSTLENSSVPFMSVLNYLKTPALQTLTLDVPYDTSTRVSDMSTFLSFAARSSLQLQTLTLSFVPMTAEILIEWLKATPSLVKLTLEPPVGVKMNLILSELTDNSKFLPNLRCLRLFFSCIPVPLHEITPAALVKLLCWRWEAVGIAQLLFFRLSYNSHELSFKKTINSSPDLQRLKKEGLISHIGASWSPIDSSDE
ncbi:hypothetical protein C8R43DRAFT_992960 [Mycena crocata]|nr:hypothetical protein C8R43DRAFT_992960 [Mycena crocata]